MQIEDTEKEGWDHLTIYAAERAAGDYRAACRALCRATGNDHAAGMPENCWFCAGRCIPYGSALEYVPLQWDGKEIRHGDVFPTPFAWEKDLSPWSLLMNAVILQAAEDYREACSELRSNAQNEMAADRKKEVEGFFFSEDCLRYTALPGRTILEMLDKEQEELWTD